VVARLSTAERATQARRQVRLLAEEDGEERPLGDDSAHVETDEAAELRGGLLAACPDRHEIALEHRHRPMEDRGEQLFLRAEVAVERRLRDADAPRELVQCRGPIASLAKQVGRRGEDPGAQHLVPRAGATQWWHVTQSSGAFVPFAFS